MDKHNDIADEIHKLTQEVKYLINIVGNVANAQQSLSIYDKMENNYCPQHTQLVCDIGVIKEKVTNIDIRINGSIDDIHEHIKSGQSWRLGIVGVAAMFIVQIIVLANMWGRLTKIVEVNTGRLDKIENKIFYVKGERGEQGIQGIQGEQGVSGYYEKSKP